jgi:hypothetical protein
MRENEREGGDRENNGREVKTRDINIEKQRETEIERERERGE